MHKIVELFVTQGCSVCPTMKRIFQQLAQSGGVDELNIYDLTDHPDLAKQHNIRSVPFYRINGTPFSGLRTLHEIESLLQASTVEAGSSWIVEQLREGQLAEVEQAVLQQANIREGLMRLLEAEDTELVVRIGLSAVIESLAERRIFDQYAQRFIDLTQHHEERIAIDALYYLQLISTPSTLKRLQQLAEAGQGELSIQAQELLAEAAQGVVVH